jgi:pimeloyl-ACP methyl ester carboxylesterase
MTDLPLAPSPTGTLTLAEGRILAWDEHGDPDGPAVVFMHGAPACRVGWPGLPQAAAEVGVRLIVPDRPGCGRSTFDPDRRLLDWPADISALADELGLDRFAVVGESGGGPYALACAATGDPRLTRAVSVVGIGPLDTPEAIAGLGDINRGIFELAATGPEAAIPLIEAMTAPPVDQPADADGDAGADPMAAILERLAPEDRAALADHPDLLQASNLVETTALGPEGVAYDLWLFTQPWGFDPALISVPVDLYAGDHDRNVPLRHAVDLAAVIPTSTLTVWPASGHLAGLLRSAEVLGRLTVVLRGNSRYL